MKKDFIKIDLSISLMFICVLSSLIIGLILK